jgi:hypothetical protein
MPGSWPGGKGLLLKKHRPIGFRISNCEFRILGFSIRIPQPAFRNSSGSQDKSALSGSCIFKHPALPEAMTWKGEGSSEIFVVMRKGKMYVR